MSFAWWCYVQNEDFVLERQTTKYTHGVGYILQSMKNVKSFRFGKCTVTCVGINTYRNTEFKHNENSCSKEYLIDSLLTTNNFFIEAVSNILLENDTP